MNAKKLILFIGLTLSAAGAVMAQDSQGNCTSTGGALGGRTTDYKGDKFGGDPVSMSTGALTLSRTDLIVPGPIPITVLRTYSSQPSGSTPAGWEMTVGKGVTFGGAGISYFRGDGVGLPLYFDTKDGAGNWDKQHAVSKQRPFYTMTRGADGTVIVNDPQGNKDFFGEVGSTFALVTKSVDRHGNELDYTYDAAQRLIKIEDPADGRYVTVGYDSNGNMSTISDWAGRTVTYAWSPTAPGSIFVKLDSVTSPATVDFPHGITESYGYDIHTQALTSVVDGKGNVILANVYGTVGASLGKIVQQTVNGHTDGFSYDLGQNETIYTDYKGNETDYFSDGNGNIVKQVVHTSGLHAGVPSGTTYTTTYTYGTGTDGNGGPTPNSSQPNNCCKVSETDPNGNVTMWTYDDNCNILTVTKISGNVDPSKGTQATSTTTTYKYESIYNKLISVEDPNSRITTYDYGTPPSGGGTVTSLQGTPTPYRTASGANNPGDLLQITYPTTAAGTATETFAYNSKGQVLVDATPDGVTRNTYGDGTDVTTDTSSGRLITTVKDSGIGGLNATTQYTYDIYGHVASVEDPNLHTTNTTTNALDQVIEIDGASGEVEQKFYDADGLLTVDQKKAPDTGGFEKTVNVYNTNQQLTATQRYTDATHFLETDYAYDNNGNLTTVTDPLGHAVATAYDERDKAYKITDALGHATTYDFDGNGNTIKLTDELGHVTAYAYDGWNRLEQKTFPDGSFQTWTYDAAGNITGLLTTAGNTITQTYDERNRMLTQSYTASSGPSTITNVYDIMGRVHTSTEGGTSLTYVYDHLGRNTSFTDQAGLVSSYTYDLDGHRLTSSYPTSVTVKRAYDASSRLSTLKDGSNTTMATYSYDILDRVTGVEMANGTGASYGYDLVNRLGNVNNRIRSGSRNYSYVYDDASRVTSATEPRGTIATGYTDRNEVNSITEPGGSPFADQGFVYDAGYNRSSWTLGASTTSYLVNNMNQYSVVGGMTAPTWNTDGGLHVFAGNTYSYDALQRLTEVDYSGGKTLFSYDPLGRRVKKVDENGSGTVLSTFKYHYDGSEVAVEYQPSTTWTYYLGLGLDQVVMRDSGTAKEWYYRDGHGSTSAVCDNNGIVMENYEYNAQGQFQITNASGTVETTTQIANDLLYTGRNYDYETGNYFYRARYYNPQLGRFISRDPLSGAEFSQGTNLYAYCRNNFLNSIDPTGMCQLDGKLTAGGYYGSNAYDQSLLPGGPNLDLPEIAGVIVGDLVQDATGLVAIPFLAVAGFVEGGPVGGVATGTVGAVLAYGAGSAADEATQGTINAAVDQIEASNAQMEASAQGQNALNNPTNLTDAANAQAYNTYSQNVNGL